jgi:transcriptional regulator with XRE-family HTH domain
MVACFTLLAMPVDDKKAFSERLKLALRRAKKAVQSPTDLAREFNLRSSESSVTVQAAQRWLAGTSMPTPDKIEILAAWLDVSPHWLRYGNPERKSPAKVKTTDLVGLPVAEQTLLSHYRQLTPRQQSVVSDLLLELAFKTEL